MYFFILVCNYNKKNFKKIFDNSFFLPYVYSKNTKNKLFSCKNQQNFASLYSITLKISVTLSCIASYQITLKLSNNNNPSPVGLE